MGIGKSFSIVFFSIILLSYSSMSVLPQAFANGETADLTLGQTDLNSAVSNLSDTTLRNPLTTAIDGFGNIWVADADNNRVLRYDQPYSIGDSATIVLGQSDFISNGVGLDASSMNSPRGLSFDGNFHLWVSDSGNNRVLRFSISGITSGQTADVVIGQSDFTSSSANPGGVNIDTLSSPQGLFIDHSNNYLWVADSDNNRVLRYSTLTTGSSADLVLGQGNFVSSGFGVTDVTLDQPNGVTVDGSGNVWIADSENNRVLKFNTPLASGEAADLVLGQPGFVTNDNNNLSVTANTLNKPQSVAVDSFGNVWIADGSNNRLLFYVAPSTIGQAATQVLGHPQLTSGNPNGGGSTSAASLFSPQHVLVVGSTVFTADSANNRILKYSTLTTGSSADLVLGQGDFISNDSGNGGLSASSLSLSQGVITDDSGNIWVADTANNRVLRYSPSFSDGQAANLVLGQTDFTSNEIGFDSRSLVSPTDLGLDPEGNLWVVDSGNSRIVRFNDGDSDPSTSNFVSNQIANLVLGQPNFSTNLPNQGGSATPSTLNFPVGIEVIFNPDLGLIVAVADTGNDRVSAFIDPVSDGQASLFSFGGPGVTSDSTMSAPTDVTIGQIGILISDTGNNRVIVVSGDTGLIETVLGQPDDVSNSPNAFGVSAQSLSNPRGLTLDGSGNLWVTDSGNHRTLLFVSSFSDASPAAGVIGQPDLTSNDSNNGGVSATSQSSPSGVTVNSSGELWVADSNNNRVLHYIDLPVVVTDPDDDNDGWTVGEGDCDDSDPNVNPDEFDIPNNGIDEDCMGGDAQDGGGSGGDHNDVLNAITDAKDMILNAITGLSNTLDNIRGIVEGTRGDLTNVAINVDDIQQHVWDIKDSVEDPATGLVEIKREIAIIESNVIEMNNKIDNLIIGLPGEAIQQIDIAVSEADGKESFLVLTTVNGQPIDVEIDQLLIVKKKGEISILTSDEYETTAHDIGLFTLNIDKKAFKDKKSLQLLVSVSDGDSTLYGAILFDDKLDKNTSQ